MPRLSKIGAAALAAFGWTSGGAAAVTASYLVVAGGGGAGGDNSGLGGGGGGGAGGLLASTISLDSTLSYTVTVGAGGAGGVTSTSGSTGSNSTFSAITTNGGGYGTRAGAATQGGSGGSGGGSSTNSSGTTAGGAGNTPSTSPSQGNNGGSVSSATTFQVGSGGGGAGAVGSNGSTASGTATGGAGGVGVASSISGTSTYYAGGGGGGGDNRVTVTYGAGGNGGGGSATSSATGNAGTANTGGGGGSGATNGGKGGSGIVIISYPAPQKFGGGTVTTSGSNVIHTFTTSGTLTPISSLSASYLIVAGGAGGGSSLWASTTNGAGGGGAGGLLSGSGITIDTNSIYVVTVGAGGSGSTAVNVNGSSGTNSILSAITALGGGGGGSQSNVNPFIMGSGQTGGSGGGGCGAQVGNTAGGAGTGTSGQGYNGGAGLSQDPNRPAGGGGGSGGAGVSGSGSNGGNGGIATLSSISGTSTYYAGGGGGGVVGGTAGLGGGTATTANKGGAGDGAVATANGGAATANTGGGGGGSAGAGSGNGGNGGSGIVIISYAGSTQQMAGGTVTSVGGNTIHTFTSSGYLTPLKLVGNSLRFRSSASAYLNRTWSSAPTSTTTQTFSWWVKLGNVNPSSNAFPGIYGSNGSTEGGFSYRNSADTYPFAFKWEMNGPTYNITTSAVFRDPAAWYHIVCVYDTSNATASERLRMYINGVRVTAFAASNYPTQNFASPLLSNGAASFIGKYTGASNYTDFYTTEFYAIDGQALTPNSFGSFNSYGVWQPITYGGSYGTNGFYLPFSNKTSTTTLGYDFSPNGNNWTTNNISLTAGSTYDSMTDVPTLTSTTAANYCVMNPLDKYSNVTLSNGNLSATFSAYTGFVRSTFAIPSTGQWYWEGTVPTSDVRAEFGIATFTQALGVDPQGAAGCWIWYSNGTNSYKYNSGTQTSWGTAWTSGDIIGIAFDAGAGTLTYYKNGSLQGGGAAFTGLTGTYSPMVGFGNNTSTAISVNFGQQPFVYTPPSGFVALNTYNIAAGTVTTSGTFTGNASTNGPFVYLNGAPLSLTINGNTVTFGTHANKTANGFQVITSSSSYNASGSNTYTVVTAGSVFKRGNAQPNP
jgi:hypothetical protein